MAANPGSSLLRSSYVPFGTHLKGDQCLFHVYAPHAEKVSVLGDFSDWYPLPMKRGNSGIWRITLDHISPGQAYQFNLTSPGGQVIRKSDPCGTGFQKPPLRASVVHDLNYTWKDEIWLKNRRCCGDSSHPMLIYQLDPLSWRRDAQGQVMPISKLSAWLIPHVKRLGCTHVELLPVMDSVPGEGTTGFFSLNPALGIPHDLMSFIDELHQAGIGVILDWELSRFSKDLFGLDRFDGEATFEGDIPLHFDFSSFPVRNFLTISARFWIEIYHADGIKISHLEELLWPDEEDTDWEAVSFLRSLNTELHSRYPGITTIAQGAADWPHLTGGAIEDERSLGFDLCWNLHWQKTALAYQAVDPIDRKDRHTDLTTPLLYAFDEQYILPVSLDLMEDASLVDHMFGKDTMHKLAAVRTFYLYQLTQPGKKLISMGSEFSQVSPWNRNQSLDWHLLQYPWSQKQLEFFRAAGDLYLSSPTLWEGEDSWRCYQWIVADDAAANTVYYLRTATDGSTLLVAINFSGLDRRSLGVGVPKTESGTWEVLLSTDDRRWGGRGKSSSGTLREITISRHGQEQSLFLDLPPMTGLILQPVEKE